MGEFSMLNQNHRCIIYNFLFILILLYFLSLNAVALDTDHILINEIMYDPSNDDSTYEWIELYNPTNITFNLSNWSITDNTATDTLQPYDPLENNSMILQPYSYALITDQDTKVYQNLSNSSQILRVSVDDKSIGNGLGNNEDFIQIINESSFIIDAVEWGVDNPLIPGNPISLVLEGHSLCRYNSTDLDNTSIEFYEGLQPTPGEKNIFVEKGSIHILTFPDYIPKAYENEDYSLPSLIQLQIQNYTEDTTYELKTYITGEEQTTYPASQTWNGSTWVYSDRYSLNITTDENGQWAGWIALRFNTGYLAYKDSIKDNSTCLINIKVRKNEYIDHFSKTVQLLDMDNSTTNATKGGYITSTSSFPNHIIILKNQNDSNLGIYRTENNNINEDICTEDGYIRITAPTGSNYHLIIYDETMSPIETINNITIEQGRYLLSILSPETSFQLHPKEQVTIPLSLTNTGDFIDTITLQMETLGNHWSTRLEKTEIQLDKKTNQTILLTIKPPAHPQQQYLNEQITITASSQKDKNILEKRTFNCELIGPDLTIKKILCYDETDNETTSVYEGQSVRIKAYLKNQGTENATNVYASFFYDALDNDHLIGTKYYDIVSTYQKYPSIIWDTHNIPPGKHTIYVIADHDNRITETDEFNNQLETTIYLFDTQPLAAETSLLISEVYYYAHSGIQNEYVTISNPTNSSIDISGWYLTTKPWKSREDQQKLYFPDNTTINAFKTLTITQNATAFKRETGLLPDYEYLDDSLPLVPQLYSTSTVTLSNTGGVVALKDYYNHTIDIVLYGDITETFEGWNGSPVPSSSCGDILKRNEIFSFPIDTNRSDDWVTLRRYGIGQSRFPLQSFTGNSTITTFISPDCSYNVIEQYVQNATTSISFNIYEFTSPFLCDLLIDALKQNVSVRIFLEGSPIGGIPEEELVLLNRLNTYGATIRFIVQNTSNDAYARYPFDHAKYLVIDGQIVIVESCNWVNTGVPFNPTYGNREWGIVIENKEVANYILSVFEDDWNPERVDSISFDELEVEIPSISYIQKNVYYGNYIPQFTPRSYTGLCTIKPVFSPDTSLEGILQMIESAKKSIYIEQLYIYRDWDEQTSPLVQKLAEKARQGIDIRILMNYNPLYEPSNEECNQTKQYLEEYGVQVQFIYTNWSIFSNLHNKGMVIDNSSVLISSINWNENSFMNNREAGIIVTCEEIASYYTDVFFFDWNLNETSFESISRMNENEESKNTIYIVSVFTMTFAVIARDWRKRKWT